MNPVTVFVVEDEQNIAQLMKMHLEKEGFGVKLFADGESALEALKNKVPDLLCLDILLPGISGLQLCQYLKSSEQFKTIPLLIVSALGEEEDVVKGLDLGADDYVPKPFSPKLFRARVKSVLRRSYIRSESPIAKTIIEYGPFVLDKRRHNLHVDGGERALTATEFSIFYLLLQNPGTVFTRSQIVNSIRGEQHAITDRSVDFQMVGLRRKIEPHGSIIEAVRGVGYRLKELDE